VTVRCDDCVDAILALNRPRVTRQMLEEPYVPERLSERLASDLDAGVAMAADERLRRSAEESAARLAAAQESIAQTAVVDPANEPTIETPAVALDAAAIGQGSFARRATAPQAGAPDIQGSGPPEPDADDEWGDTW
jgi:hypothetical protein